MNSALSSIRCRLLFALLIPSVSFAQSEFGAGMNIKIQVNESTGRSPVKGAVHEEQKGDGFHITWDTDPDGHTWFKVMSPEGAQIRVIDDIDFPVASGAVPVSFRASGKKFYQVELRTPGGAFVRKFEAKEGMVAQLWVAGGSKPAQQPIAAAGPCGSDSDLQQVSSAIESESFSAGKLRVLGDAVEARGFCVDHAVAVLKLFSFENDRLSALKLLAPRLSDRQNKFKVYKAFDFDSSRDQAKKILQ